MHLSRHGQRWVLKAELPNSAHSGRGDRQQQSKVTRGSSARLSATLAAMDLAVLARYAGFFGGLTLLRSPDTPDEFYLLVKRWLQRLRKRGWLWAYIWVRENQPRLTGFGRRWRAAEAARLGYDPGGVPHLHPLVFLICEAVADAGGPDVVAKVLISDWLEIAAAYGPEARAHEDAIEPVRRIERIGAYQAMHGNRSAKNIQRDHRYLPTLWRRHIEAGGSLGHWWMKSRNLPLVARRDFEEPEWYGLGRQPGVSPMWAVFQRSVAIAQAREASAKGAGGGFSIAKGQAVYDAIMARPLWAGVSWWSETPDAELAMLEAARDGVVLGLDNDIWSAEAREGRVVALRSLFGADEPDEMVREGKEVG